jgi:flagellar hook assembly protein FlgD
VQSLSTLPTAFALHSNYPNPFNSATTIRFSLERSGLVELAIYNLAGQTVRRLLAGEVAAGEHEVQWDGRDAHGQAMATGVYCCVLRLNSSRSARRMLLLR